MPVARRVVAGARVVRMSGVVRDRSFGDVSLTGVIGDARRAVAAAVLRDLQTWA
jgi:hypothetical protein